MAPQDPIWARAREDLIVADEHGQEEVFLWEHSQRVVRCAIEGVPALVGVAPDELEGDALRVAALYHDAGWALQYRDGEVTRSGILSRGTSRDQRELGAELMRSRLSKLLPPKTLQQAYDWILQMDLAGVEATEARILADSENLDWTGTLLYWRIVRRHALEGKGVQGAIETWQAHKQYRFWESRIEAIHFDAVRQVARSRLERFDRFMQELARQHCCEDLPGVSTARLDVQ